MVLRERKKPRREREAKDKMEDGREKIEERRTTASLGRPSLWDWDDRHAFGVTWTRGTTRGKI
jgi:hypothetical protein